MNNLAFLVTTAFFFFLINLKAQPIPEMDQAILESEISLEKFNYPKPNKNSNRGDFLSFINNVEKEIDLRLNLKEKLTSALSELDNQASNIYSPNIQFSSLKKLKNIIIKQLVNDRIINQTKSIKTSENYELKKIYLNRINQQLNSNNTKTQERPNPQYDSLHTIYVNKIVNEDTAIANLELEIDKTSDFLNQKNTTANSFKLTKDQNLPFGKTNFSIVKNVTSNIATLERSRLIFTPNFELDNKVFEDRKGFMNWPLLEAKLISRYNEYIDQSGSNAIQKGLIISSKEPYVQSVCQGIVASVIVNSELDNTVIIKHDKGYYSVYTNIAESFVEKNQKIKYNQSIGKARGESSNYKIQIQIWDKNQNLNPSQWLKNK